MQKIYTNSGYCLIEGNIVIACCLLEDLPPELSKLITRSYDTKESGTYYTNYEDRDLRFSTVIADKELRRFK